MAKKVKAVYFFPFFLNPKSPTSAEPNRKMLWGIGVCIVADHSTALTKSELKSVFNIIGGVIPVERAMTFPMS